MREVGTDVITGQGGVEGSEVTGGFQYAGK